MGTSYKVDGKSQNWAEEGQWGLKEPLGLRGMPVAVNGLSSFQGQEPRPLRVEIVQAHSPGTQGSDTTNNSSPSWLRTLNHLT